MAKPMQETKHDLGSIRGRVRDMLENHQPGDFVRVSMVVFEEMKWLLDQIDAKKEVAAA